MNEMMKKYKRLIGCIIIICILCGVILSFVFSKLFNKMAENPITEEDFLETYNDKIVNQKKEEILLKGTNLGGWLLQEYWMCPVVGDKNIEQWTNEETLQVLEERFGEKKTQELIKEYEDNWITEWDIKNIAKKGCNVIRIPFWYRNFMKDANGTWLTKKIDDNPGIKRLDWVIDTAQKYGIYVILDMHGCPGGQSYNHSTGTARKYELFTNEKYQDAMEELWVTIAKRYKDNPAVAAYDIMNEAQEYNGDIDSDPRNKLYDRMIKAIREVDNRHIITVEGIWGLEVLPNPKDVGWKNILYQVHFYNVNDVEAAENLCNNLDQYSKNYNIPVYLGEFSYMGFIDSCKKYNIHYTTWSYKGSVDMNDTWFMYYKNLEQADIKNDTYEQIKKKWGNCLNTKKFDEDTEITKYYKQ